MSFDTVHGLKRGVDGSGDPWDIYTFNMEYGIRNLEPGTWNMEHGVPRHGVAVGDSVSCPIHPFIHFPFIPPFLFDQDCLSSENRRKDTVEI